MLIKTLNSWKVSLFLLKLKTAMIYRKNINDIGNVDSKVLKTKLMYPNMAKETDKQN